jgi:hypothetical protein
MEKRMKESKNPYLSQNHFTDWLESPEKMLKRCNKNNSQLTEASKKLCDFGNMIHNRAKLSYPNGIEPTDNRTIDTYQSQSLALLKAGIPVFEPQFQYDGLFARIDILSLTTDDTWELIEVKSAKNIHEDWIKYTAFLYYVCINAGIKISKCSIMHLQEYIYDNTPLDKTFDKTDITGKVINLQEEIVENIKQMRKLANKESHDV